MANERGRELVAVAAALAAHALLLVLHRVAPPGPDLTAHQRDAELPADTFDIETTPPAPPAAPAPAAQADDSSDDQADEQDEPEPPGAAQAKIAPRQDPLVPPPSTPEPPSPPAQAPTGGETAAPTPAPGNAGGDEYGPPPGGGTVGLPPGVNAPIWSIPGVLPNAGAPRPAPTSVEAPKPVDANIAGQVLAGTLHSKDKAMGIDIPGAGVVATTVADAVRTSSIRDARATFEVKLAGDGTVQGVRMVSASGGDAQTWAAIVNAAKSTLSAKSLQMGPDGKGATVTVKIESKIQYPAGSKERYTVEPVCANEIVQMIEDAIQDGASAGMAGMARGVRTDSGRFIPYNEMSEEERSRFCIPLPAIRVKGDLSNLGAHTTNFVSSSFQVKRDGEKSLPAEATLPLETRAPWLPVRDGKVRAPPPPKKKKKKKGR
ncbi:hypothetical protein [Polyangium aurulentum]|uniref:hypothetical protein n=1 Tax=Polyangium aurulentum TaxID=2567896 RepID=UPI0010AE39B7|nr:hypothetical protein [Polyangium aurulentum]UQA63054.1 hypothetical protein E8A73_022365 [Polyangium aurulentum]